MWLKKQTHLANPQCYQFLSWMLARSEGSKTALTGSFLPLPMPLGSKPWIVWERDRLPCISPASPTSKEAAFCSSLRANSPLALSCILRSFSPSAFSFSALRAYISPTLNLFQALDIFRAELWCSCRRNRRKLRLKESI